MSTLSNRFQFAQRNRMIAPSCCHTRGRLCLLNGSHNKREWMVLWTRKRVLFIIRVKNLSHSCVTHAPSVWRKDNEIFLSSPSDDSSRAICEQQNRFCEVLWSETVTINYRHDRLISGLFSQWGEQRILSSLSLLPLTISPSNKENLCLCLESSHFSAFIISNILKFKQSVCYNTYCAQSPKWTITTKYPEVVGHLRGLKNCGQRTI